MKLYNTLSRSTEEFIAIKPPFVSMYACGPTVYDYAHIGHMRKYVGDDILVRVLRLNNYKVKHVMNITDVGHLVSDSNEGEDKMEKGARKFGKSVWDIAKMFEQQFFNSCKSLNIPGPTILMHATDFIHEQIKLIKTLQKKGYTYTIEDGLYFDTSKYPNYFQLSHQNPDELKAGARVEFITGKRNVTDFALWKFSSKNEKRQMEWDSPWGIGFPGWHIECSAMSMKELGSQFDIHTGGIDHIPIHHTNEIAQSEAATGKKFVNYWVHHNFLMIEGQKMSKSLENMFTVQDIIAKGFDPLTLRYLFLQAHYRQEMNFTWESLNAAQTALYRLKAEISTWSIGSSSQAKKTNSKNNFIERFKQALNEDLNTAKALSILWEVIKSDYSTIEKIATIKEFDKVFGIDLFKKEAIEIPDEIKILLKQREKARKEGDYAKSDEIREKISNLNFIVQDSKHGQVITHK